MSKSDYLEAAVLNHVFRGTGLAVPANVYVSLHTADPGDTGGNEVATAGTGYARVAVAGAAGSWSAPADSGVAKQIANSAAIVFPNATGDWGTVTHFGIWDAASGGNFLYRGVLAVGRAILAGDVAPQFAAGAVTISES